MEHISLKKECTYFTMELDGNIDKIIGRDVDGVNNVLITGDIDVIEGIRWKRHMVVSGQKEQGTVRIESTASFRILSRDQVKNVIGTKGLPAIVVVDPNIEVVERSKCNIEDKDEEKDDANLIYIRIVNSKMT